MTDRDTGMGKRDSVFRYQQKLLQKTAANRALKRRCNLDLVAGRIQDLTENHTVKEHA